VLGRALLQDRGAFPVLCLDPHFPLDRAGANALGGGGSGAGSGGVSSGERDTAAEAGPTEDGNAAGAADEDGDDEEEAGPVSRRPRFVRGFRVGVQGFVAECRDDEALAHFLSLLARVTRQPCLSLRPVVVTAAAATDDDGAGGDALGGANGGVAAVAGWLGGGGPVVAWVAHGGGALAAGLDVVGKGGDWAAYQLVKPALGRHEPWTCVNCSDTNPGYRRGCDCGLGRGLTLRQVVDRAPPLLPQHRALAAAAAASTPAEGRCSRRVMCAVDGHEEMLYHADGAGLPPDDGDGDGHDGHADFDGQATEEGGGDVAMRALAAPASSGGSSWTHGWRRVLAEAPSAHPERPDRLRAILRRLDVTGLLRRTGRVPCREATNAELLLCHPQGHVDKVEATAALEPVEGGDTDAWRDAYCCPGTARAAKVAAGTTVDLALALCEARAKDASAAARGGDLAPVVAWPVHGVALVRPPGHHAEADVCMGFCIYNNAALAAAAALQASPESGGVERVLIVDWDVHHGNGTQAMFEDDPRVLYVSLHRYPFYPNTGSPRECGTGRGKGYTVNIGWPEGGVGDAEYLAAFRQLVLPIARSFDPQLVLISAGFDAAEGDPLGGCNLTPAGYSHMTSELLGLHAGKARVLLVLEGGYNLTSIARSAEACVRVLLGEPPLPFPVGHDASYLLESADEAILHTAAVHVRLWPALRSVWGSSLDQMAAKIALAEETAERRAAADAAAADRDLRDEAAAAAAAAAAELDRLRDADILAQQRGDGATGVVGGGVGVTQPPPLLGPPPPLSGPHQSDASDSEAA
jgi:histone deacetylase 6